jgi:hypothetical protein
MVPARMSRCRDVEIRRRRLRVAIRNCPDGFKSKVDVDCSPPAPMDDIRRKAALSRCLAWHPYDDETGHKPPPNIYQLNVPWSGGLGAMMHRRGCHLHRK